MHVMLFSVGLPGLVLEFNATSLHTFLQARRQLLRSNYGNYGE